MKKDLHILQETLIKYIKENFSSNSMMKNILCQYKKMLVYMKENSLSMYSPEIGQDYLNYRNLIRISKNRKIPVFQHEIRYITLLNGMLNGEWVIKMSKTNYHKPFPGNFGNYIMTFLNKYAEERRISTKTRSNYYHALFKFCERMQYEEVISLTDITAERILDFVSSVQNCKDHVAIILRALLKQLHVENFIDHRAANILENLKTKAPEKLPSYFKPIEIESIETAVDRKYPVGKRNYAMILLATRLGLRSSDIRFLKFSNINWDNNYIYIEQFKTKKIVELPLLTDVGEAIIDYIQHGRPKTDSKHIFLRLNPPYEPITSGGLYSIIQNYLKLANINIAKKRHGSHAMRHSLATNLIRKGIPIGIISDTLGHANYESTAKYIHLNVEELIKCSLSVPPVNENFYLQKGNGIYE